MKHKRIIELLVKMLSGKANLMLRKLWRRKATEPLAPKQPIFILKDQKQNYFNKSFLQIICPISDIRAKIF